MLRHAMATLLVVTVGVAAIVFADAFGHPIDPLSWIGGAFFMVFSDIAHSRIRKSGNPSPDQPRKEN